MAAKQPSISVCIISYNFEPYIGECIESILAQTLQPMEIIICDDHSADNTWPIIQEYAEKHPELIRAFCHPKNIGAISNEIFTRQKIQGEWFSQVDGDDRWLPRKLELEWQALQRNPQAKAAYSQVIEIDTQGKVIQTWGGPEDPPPPQGDIFIPTFAKRFFPHNRSVFRNELVNRQAMEQVGMFHTDDFIHVDWDKKIRFTSRFPVVYSGETQVEYRQHEGGLSRKSGRRNIDSIRAVYAKNKHLLGNRSREEAQFVEQSITQLLSNLEQKFGVVQPQMKNTSPSEATKPSVLPRLLVNSLPKSGTHLIKKVVGLLGIKSTTVHISKNLVQGNESLVEPQHLLPAGVDWPEPITDKIVVQSLHGISPGHFSTAHMPYSSLFGTILDQMNIKSFLILRDPRDVVLSMANYVIQDPAHFLFDVYKRLTEEERIKVSITGFESDGNGAPGLYDIGARWRKVNPWLAQPYNYTTYFEKLVGPHGGGSVQDQMREIENIARHLEIRKNRSEIAALADQVFGGTKTFRKGKIAAWREKFTREHKQLFKKYAGDILVKWGYEQNMDW